MLEDLISSVASGGILGGVLGAAGSILTKRQERLLQRDKNAHEIRLVEIGIEERKLEIEAEIRVAEQRGLQIKTEAERDIEVSSISAFQESIKSAAVLSGIKWIDGVRALMRPALTLLTMSAFLVVAFNAWRYSSGLNPATLDELIVSVTNQIVFFAGTGFTWWFGSRPSSERRI